MLLAPPLSNTNFVIEVVLFFLNVNDHLPKENIPRKLLLKMSIRRTIFVKELSVNFTASELLIHVESKPTDPVVEFNK